MSNNLGTPAGQNARSRSGQAIFWAKDHFPSTSIEQFTRHAWAKTYRLYGEGENAFLKTIEKSDPLRNQAIVTIATTFAPHVPSVIAADCKRGFFIFKDHQGTEFSRKIPEPTRRALLSLYGELQGRAVEKQELLSRLEKTSCVEQFDKLIELMQQAVGKVSKPGSEGNPFRYLKPSSVGRYLAIFQAADPLIREFLSAGDALAPTLNHGDLRAKNVAQNSKGELVIFDWDDAAYAPPGFSLHAQFSGCTRVFSAMASDGTASAKDRLVLQGYISSLGEHGGYSPQDLQNALPATAAAGVIYYITGFAKHPANSERSQKAISGNVRKRLSDLMDLVVLLADRSPIDCASLIEAFEKGGRTSRAEAIKSRRSPSKITSARLQSLIDASDPPDVFPSVHISEAELRRGKLSSDTQKLAVSLFQRHGGLMIADAFDPRQIEEMKHEFDTMKNQHDQAIQKGGALRVGNQRYMLSVPLTGAFANPDAVASPFVLPILRRLLSRDLILGSLTVVASLPGAKDQSLHRDNPPLFTEQTNIATPSFCVALIIPLISLNEETGATRIIKGSHRLSKNQLTGLPYQNPTVDLGSCYLMDSRLYHQGMANRSPQTRPILSLVYQRPWYRDHKNFKKQSPLIMSKHQLDGLPEEMRGLVAWARETST